MIDLFIGPNRFLSNFELLDVAYPDPEVPGLSYPTVEHAFQALKTHSAAERRAVAAEGTPGRAKRAGRKVTMRSDWDQAREGVMLTLLRFKFGQPRLAAQLRSTGTERLIEGNDWHDTFWGVCTCAEHHGAGANKLGELLMQVRAEIG